MNKTKSTKSKSEEDLVDAADLDVRKGELLFKLREITVMGDSAARDRVES